MPVIVTLTTDFGTRDGYVGAMKGVLARLAPDAIVVDITHDVPRHDIAHGAWVLATSTREFPMGSIHVAVVDPGVGGARAGVIVAVGGHLYVGPDNGLFAYVASSTDDGAPRGPASRAGEGGGTSAARAEQGAEAYAITSTAFRMPEASSTFHGRDVFAPTAAALARGLRPRTAGPATCLLGALPWRARADETGGVVVHVDVFGNLITNLPGPARALRIGARIARAVQTYEDLAADELGCYLGSAGTLELAIREGSAAATLGLGRGTPVGT